MKQWTYPGHAGELAAQAWLVDQPRYVVVLCHGYGEHIGRYDWVARTLNEHGASVYGVDHAGHGRSEGERVLITDYDDVVADFHQLVRTAKEENPGLPVVLIGHSMGGMIAARYLQLHGEEVAAAVLSGPVIGSWATVDTLLPQEEIPPTPIDPSTLSRDPAVGGDLRRRPARVAWQLQEAHPPGAAGLHGPHRRRRLHRGPAAAVPARRGAPARPHRSEPGRHGGDPRAAHRGEDLPGRPARDLQRDEQGGGPGRRHLLHRPRARQLRAGEQQRDIRRGASRP